MPKEEHYLYLLGNVQQRVRSDVCFLYELEDEDNPPLTLPTHAVDVPKDEIRAHWQGHAKHIVTFSAGQLSSYPTGVVCFAPAGPRTLVMGALSRTKRAYTTDEIEELQAAASLAAALAGWTTEPAHQPMSACHQLLQVETIQEVVDTLHQQVFDESVTLCAILLYGPSANEEEQHHEYAEVSGMWSRQSGSGYGIGSRFYLDDKRKLVRLLHTQKYVRGDEELLRHFGQDALLMGLARTVHPQNWVLFGLGTADRRLGVMVISTETQGGFSQAQVDRISHIREFVTKALLLQTLQYEQHTNRYGRDTLLDAVRDGILIAIPGSNGANVIAMNRRFRQMFNYPDNRETNYGKLTDVLSQMPLLPSVRQAIRETWKSVPFRDQSTLHGEFEMTTHEGQPADVTWYSAPMYNPRGDEVFARLLIFHDATPERAATRARSVFFSRVSHELRTPLTSISGFAQFILEATGEDLPKLAREYTEIIQDSAHHLKHVFTVLLKITRVQSGEVKLQRTHCDLEEIIRGVLREHRNALHREQITPQLHVNVVPPVVIADPDNIRQVIHELVDNTLLYHPGNGDLKIAISQVTRSQELPINSPDDLILPALMLCVQDDGPGLPPDNPQAVFEPFYRGREAHAKQIGGNGLGLTLASSLIEMHRGKLWAGEGPGAVFYFTLPTSNPI